MFLILMNFYISCTFLFNWEMTFSFTLALLSAVLFLYAMKLKKGDVISITILDASIALYVLYNVIHIFAKGSVYIDNADICKWGSVIGIYLIVRNLQNKKIVFYTLVLSGVEEAITAIAQKLYLLESNHVRFDVTGHLGNPGPLGGYLAVCLLIAIYLLWEKRQNKKLWMTIGLVSAILLMAIGIILTDSRAAVLGVLLGCMWLPPIYRFLFRYYCKVVVVISLFLIFSVGTLFYLYRPQSADARLLIWKISSEMIADNLWFGHGIGSFSKHYMFYQASYFEHTDNEAHIMVADNAAYAYNELIHLSVETGIVGLLFALGIIGIVYKKNHCSDLNHQIAKVGITVWLLFSMFSYSTDVFPLLLLLPLLLACLNSKVIIINKCNYLKIFLLLIFCATIGCWGFYQGYFYKKCSEELASLFEMDNSSALMFAETHYSQLKCNIKYNMIYVGWLARHSVEQKDMSKIEKIVPGSETYCYLGDYYCRIGMNKLAEKSYRTASFMVPTRMRPNYKLWHMYLESGDTINANSMARRILVQPLKVENSFTVNAKSEVRDYLLKRKTIFK